MFPNASKVAKGHRHMLEDRIERPLVAEYFTNRDDIFMLDPLQHVNFFFGIVCRKTPHSDKVRCGALQLCRGDIVGPRVFHACHNDIVAISKSNVMEFLVFLPRRLELHDPGRLRSRFDDCRELQAL
jgi:hypothetical protein